MKYEGWTLTQIADELDAADRINTNELGETSLVVVMPDAIARQISARLRHLDDVLDAYRIDEQWQQMHDTAVEYYKLLDEGTAADLHAIKNRLDELSAPFSDNVAYHAFLEMRRAASLRGEG